MKLVDIKEESLAEKNKNLSSNYSNYANKKKIISLIRIIPAYRQAGDDKKYNLSTNCTNKH